MAIKMSVNPMVASKGPQYHPERMRLVGHVWDVLMRASPRDAVRLLPSPEWGGCARPAAAVVSPARGRPPQAAARRAGLEFVEKLLPTNLTSTDTTERNGRHASRPARASLIELAVNRAPDALIGMLAP